MLLISSYNNEKGSYLFSRVKQNECHQQPDFLNDHAYSQSATFNGMGIYSLWGIWLIAHMQVMNSYRQAGFSQGSSSLLSYGSISRFISKGGIPTKCYASNTPTADYEWDAELSIMPSQIPFVTSEASLLTSPSSPELWCINRGRRCWCCGEE